MFSLDDIKFCLEESSKFPVARGGGGSSNDGFFDMNLHPSDLTLRTFRKTPERLLRLLLPL